ncbi:MAG: transposase [Spirosomataceae bacterium]|jgi:transposase
MGFLGTTPLSWRVLEEHYKGTLFQKRFSPTSDSIDHSSISERLEKMPIEFFEQLFQFSLSLLEKYYPPKDYKRYNIIRFDSTSVTLSAKLLSDGLAGAGYPNNSSKPWKQVKFSVGFNGTCAVNAKAFFEQVYYSEDIALAEVISETSFKKNDVLVFDRGLSGKQQLKKLTLDNISFVGRLKTNTAFQACESLPFTKPQKKESDTVEILGDSLIHRMANFRKPMDVPFRLVICRIKETGEEMYLITNMLNVSALEVADIYKLRWDIELFFRFLKQNMHFDHLLSRKEHTINIVMYMSLISASMIYVYRRVNEIEGFKIAKMRFQNELIEGLIEIVGKVNENQNQTIENLAEP